MNYRCAVVALLLLAASPKAANAQAAANEDLAKQLANPVSSLISVPFQYNFDCCFGPSDASRDLLNIQPVVPFKFSPNMTLVVRTILPVIYLESPAPGLDNTLGLSEIVLERLWTTTMRIILENAGGQRGCFVIRKDGQLFMEGHSEIGREVTSSARLSTVESTEGPPALPISILYHVLHTNSPVVLHDASRAGPFAKDAYLLARKPQSVLCIPLVRQGTFEGAIYMENSLTTGVFTDERIEIIKLLAAQVSISIENAKLYEDQLHLIEAQRRFVPSQFLESLDRHDIAHIDLGEHVAKMSLR